MITDFAFITFFCQVMLNTERLLKHAVQERLAVTICINKVEICKFLLIFFLIMKMILFYLFNIIIYLSINVILRCGFGGQFT